MTPVAETTQQEDGMSRARVSLMHLLVMIAVLPLAACGGDLNIPNPATLVAQATTTTAPPRSASTPGVTANAPTPTTLTLTLGVPTSSGAGSTLTRPASMSGTPGAGGSTPRAATSVVSTGTATGNTVPYTDPMNRFTFMRPKNWQETKATNVDTVVLYVSASPNGGFNVTAKQAPAGLTLDAYVNVNVVNIRKQIPDYQDGSMKVQNSPLGGEPARQIDYYGMPGDTNSYFVQLYCIHKGTTYLLTFATPVDPTSKDMDAFNRAAQVVVSSWKFV